MKQISDTVLGILNSGIMDPFVLYEIGPAYNNTYLRGSSLPYDVNHNNITYPANGRLVNIDPPRLSNALDKESYKITLADPFFEYRSLLEGGLKKAYIKIMAGFIQNGQPLLGKYDVLVAYIGQVDTYSYTSTEDGETLVLIEGASPMGSISLSRSLLTSKDWMKQKHPTDTSFDQIFVGSQQISLQWGKKT